MKNKKVLAIVISLVLIVAGFVSALYYFGNETVEGEKNISIEVVTKDGSTTLYQVTTDAEYLLGAMEAADGLTFEGEEGDYGMTISAVNGVAADYNIDGAYWAFYLGDSYCNYGVSQQPIADGDSFKIVYTLAE